MADTCRGPIHGEGCRAVPLRACGALLDLARKREHGNSSSHFHAQTHGPSTGGNLAVRSAQAEERDHKIAQALLGGVNIFASNIARFRWRRPRRTFVESSGGDESRHEEIDVAQDPGCRCCRGTGKCCHRDQRRSAVPWPAVASVAALEPADSSTSIPFPSGTATIMGLWSLEAR
jgi:hypothetical protein